MLDTFTLLGSFATAPQEALGFSMEQFINEVVRLSSRSTQQYKLIADAPQDVDLDSMPSGVNVLIIKTTAKVRLRLTTTDGATQAIPVDTFFADISLSVPITAIDITRVAGAETTVDLFLGQKA